MKIFSFNKQTAVRVFVGFVILIILWQLISKIINNSIYVPEPIEVLHSASCIIGEKGFSKNVFFSVIRTFISFSVAFLLASIMAVIFKAFKGFNDYFKPFNSIIKTIPTMVLVVLCLIWFDKDKTPYIVGAMIVFPILFEGIYNSILKVDDEYIDLFYVYQISFKEKLKKIYIPAILLYMAKTLVSSFSLAFKVVIAGEVHGQPTYGIGSSIQNAKANFDVPKIFAWIILIAIISIFFDFLDYILNKKIKKWSGKNENISR